MPRASDDPTALAGRLYDEYGASLYRYALMLLADRSAAEDAVHQVFASFIALIAREARAIDNAEHYLRRAVRNECYSTLRRSTRDQGEVVLQPVAGVNNSPDERMALERALAALPPEQREVVHLKMYMGMTFQEIATQTSESINTVASRYRYAIDKLKALLT